MRALAKFALVIAAAACGTPQKDHDALAQAIRSYNDGVRWQRYAVAASKILPGQRGAFVDERDELADDLHITDYEIVRVDTRSDREARVQVKVSWYLDSEGVVRDTTAVQTWERHGKAWFMVDESRQRGAPMPGLADRRAGRADPGPRDAHQENH